MGMESHPIRLSWRVYSPPAFVLRHYKGVES